MQHQIRNFDPLTSFRRRASNRRRSPALTDARGSSAQPAAAGAATAAPRAIQRYDGATDIQTAAPEQRPRRPNV